MSVAFRLDKIFTLIPNGLCKIFMSYTVLLSITLQTPFCLSQSWSTSPSRPVTASWQFETQATFPVSSATLPLRSSLASNSCLNHAGMALKYGNICKVLVTIN